MRDGNRAGAGTPKPGDGGPRAERLAAALRENLRRRKAQSRGRRDDTAGGEAVRDEAVRGEANAGRADETG